MQDRDPAHIHSGVVVEQILAELGIADQIKKKTVIITDAGSALTARKVDLTFGTIAENLQRPNIAVAGPVPAELGGSIELSVGILTRNKNDADAKAFIKFITSADGAAVWSKHGLEALQKTRD
jgi:ABC-type molybdate transport system substrate-binding protein